MLGRAGNHPLLARPADAELAGIVHVHAGIEQHLEDALSLGDYEFLPRAGKLDHEPSGLGGLLLGREIFHVDLLARPIRGCGLERLEHRGRSAAIEMRVLRRSGDDGGHIEKFAFALVIEVELRRAHFLQRLQKRHVGARTARVIELPGAAELGEALHHAPDRSDADTARKQNDVSCILHQRKIVARRAYPQRLADAQLVVHVTRAAAARRIALHRDGVAGGIGLRRQQRILPHDPVRQVHIDMGARRIRR